MVDPESSDKSRQRSCNACVRSKRRCDKRTPQCTRCAERSLPCLYHPAASSSGNFAPETRRINCEDPIITPDESSMVLGAGFEYNHLLRPEPPLIQEPFTSSATGPDNSQPFLEPTLLFDPPFPGLENLTRYMTNTVLNSEMQTWQTLPIQHPTSMTTVSRPSSSPWHAGNRFSVDAGRRFSVSKYHSRVWETYCHGPGISCPTFNAKLEREIHRHIRFSPTTREWA